MPNARSQHAATGRLRHCLVVTTVSALAIGLAPSACSQGFMVKPMVIELTSPPGRQVEVAVHFTNMNPEGSIRIRADLWDVKQTLGGSWSLVESNDEATEGAIDRSCKDWLDVAQRDFDVPAGGRASIPLRITVPRRTRGFYAAAMTAMTIPKEPTPEEGKVKLGIRVRFLVPVYIHVKAPGVRERVDLKAFTLASVVEKGQATPKSAVQFIAQNAGETCPKIEGSVQVFLRVGDSWRWITRAEAPQRRVFPGCTVHLQSPLGRSLPTGEYRLDGFLRVNGRPGRRLSQIVQYEGPAGVTKLHSDVRLALEPPTVGVKTLPGATRTARVSIMNTSADTVTVRVKPVMPRALGSVCMGDLKGEDLSLHSATSIAPTEFVLAGGRERPLTVIVRMPKDWKHAYGFANLIFGAFSREGEPLGTAEGLLRVQNTTVEPKVLVKVDEPELAATEEGPWAVSALVSNVGSVDAKIAVGASVRTFIGGTVVKTDLSTDRNHLLPLGRATASGTLDVKGVEPGTYVLRVDCEEELSGEAFYREIPVVVKDIEGERVLEQIAQEDAKGEGAAE